MKPFTSFEELKDMFSKNQSVIEVLELVESHHREAELLEELNTIFVINEYGYPYTLTEVKDYIAYELECCDTWADMWEAIKED